MKNYKKKGMRVLNEEGFSLVELIVVIAIMGVLVLVMAPSLLTYNERSRAEKDSSTMDEVVNAVQLALADQEIYDEVLRFSTVDNVSCYVDTNSEANYSKVVTKKNPSGVDQYTFTSDARTLDETPYFAAGNMRGVTITFAPDKGSNGSTFDLKQGVVNQYIQINGNQRFGALPKLYNRVRSSVGEAVNASSQTYRNSEYTIFIIMGTVGGNDESAQDAIKMYGQWSGTNLPAVVSYQLVTDRVIGDTGNTIVEINDNKWNQENGNKLTLKPGDLNGGGSFTPNTSDGNQPGENEEDIPENDFTNALKNHNIQLNQIYSIMAGVNAELPQGDNGFVFKEDGTLDYYLNSNLIQQLTWTIDADGDVFIPNFNTKIHGDPSKNFIKAMAFGKIFVKGSSVVEIGDYRYELATPGTNFTAYWWVDVLDTSKTEYGSIESEINSIKVEDMTETFSGCVHMTKSPEIPSNIKLLEETYANCTALEVPPTLPSGLTSTRWAFYNCVNLTGNMTVDCNPNNVEKMFYQTVKNIHLTGESALEIKKDMADSANNHNVTYDGMPVIEPLYNSRTGEEAGFYDANGTLLAKWEELNFDINSGSSTSFSNAKSLYPDTKKVVVPDGITKVGASAFSSAAVDEVVFPDGLLEIGDKAFFLASIKKMDFPDSVKSIGTQAFALCPLTAVNLPNDLVSLGGQAFTMCTNIKTITIGPNLQELGENVFAMCDGLESITVSNSNSHFVSTSGVLFDKNKTKIIRYPSNKSGTSYSVPSTVKTIGNNAFARSKNLTSISLPTNLTMIESYSFQNCTKLKNITIPSKVTAIGECAFQFCEAMTYVTLKSGLKTIGKEAFLCCKKLSSVSIPSTVTDIGQSAFKQCDALTSVSLNNGLKTIGQWAFDMTNVSTFTIPTTVTRIEYAAFSSYQVSSLKIKYNGRTYYMSPPNASYYMIWELDDLLKSKGILVGSTLV